MCSNRNVTIDTPIKTATAVTSRRTMYLAKCVTSSPAA
jgi:hypothetical protein